MDRVNMHPSTSGDMTACLVSCMSSAKSNLNYHADDEKLIAQDSDICTVSFGPSRTLDFVWKAKNRSGRKGPPPSPDYSVSANNHSLNIMRPGCQQKLQHRVPPGQEPGIRYSLSFRRILVSDIPDNDTNPNLSTDTEALPPSVPATQEGTSSNIPAPRKKVTLLAGDSYFERLDIEKLGKGKQDVYKVARGGRKITQVQKAVEEFVNDHTDLEIKTLFICVGTNDIRHC